MLYDGNPASWEYWESVVLGGASASLFLWGFWNNSNYTAIWVEDSETLPAPRPVRKQWTYLGDWLKSHKQFYILLLVSVACMNTICFNMAFHNDQPTQEDKAPCVTTRILVYEIITYIPAYESIQWLLKGTGFFSKSV